jgi:hypothetical protein
MCVNALNVVHQDICASKTHPGYNKEPHGFFYSILEAWWLGPSMRMYPKEPQILTVEVREFLVVSNAFQNQRDWEFCYLHCFSSNTCVAVRILTPSSPLGIVLS